MMEINECFSYDKVKDVSNNCFRQGIYSRSGYDSDESIHYTEGHGTVYYENDKTKVKKKTKKKTKKDTDKMIVDENVKKK